MSKLMMKCGHAANAVDGDGNPVCVICYGIVPGADEIDDEPDLEGRKARCSYYGSSIRPPGTYHGSECGECNRRYREGERLCRCKRDSSTNLPFFEHQPDQEYDVFYCGCASWC